MFLLHVDLKPRPGERKTLEEVYGSIFQPAISAQKGFDEVRLLRPTEENGDYRLSICFEDQASQQQWVATDLHQQVWPQMAQTSLTFVVRSFHAV